MRLAVVERCQGGGQVRPGLMRTTVTKLVQIPLYVEILNSGGNLKFQWQRTNPDKNKYFCTRDKKGHVKVWSSTNHPDCIFSLFNFDADEKALAHL